jgi:hypothetical protein
MADLSIPTAMAPLAAAAIPREWADGAAGPEATPQPLIEAPSTDAGSSLHAVPVPDDDEHGAPTVGLQVPAHLFPPQNPFGDAAPQTSPDGAASAPAGALVDLGSEGEQWDDATGAMARPQPSQAPAPIDESSLSADSAVESPDFLHHGGHPDAPFDPRARQGGSAFGSSGQDNYGQSGGQPPAYPQAYPQQGYGPQGYAAPADPGALGYPADPSAADYVQPAYDPHAYPPSGAQPGYGEAPAGFDPQAYGPQSYPQQGYPQGGEYPGAQPGYPQAEAYPQGDFSVSNPYDQGGPPSWGQAVVPGQAPVPGYGVPPDAQAPARPSHPDGGPELASDDLLDDDVEDVDDAELLDDDDGRP